MDKNYYKKQQPTLDIKKLKYKKKKQSPSKPNEGKFDIVCTLHVYNIERIYVGGSKSS